MITEAVVHVACLFAAWVATLFPSWQVPDWFSGLGTTINGVLANLNGVGVWVPWTVILSVVTAVLGTWVVCAGIKLMRAIASYIPFFGGAG